MPGSREKVMASAIRQPKASDQQQEQQLIAAFYEHRRRYGVRRLVAELRAKGMNIGYYKARRIMKKYGLKAIQRQRPTATFFCTPYHR